MQTANLRKWPRVTSEVRLRTLDPLIQAIVQYFISFFFAGHFNASCPYAGPLPDNNVAAFYEDQEIKYSGSGEEAADASEDADNNNAATVERFEPGAELMFRCVDIGNKKAGLCLYLLFSTIALQHNGMLNTTANLTLYFMPKRC